MKANIFIIYSHDFTEIKFAQKINFLLKQIMDNSK